MIPCPQCREAFEELEEALRQLQEALNQPPNLPIELYGKERIIFNTLFMHKETVVYTSRLLDLTGFSTLTLRVAISKVRGKLRLNKSNLRIRNIWGVGYVLTDKPPPRTK